MGAFGRSKKSNFLVGLVRSVLYNFLTLSLIVNGQVLLGTSVHNHVEIRKIGPKVSLISRLISFPLKNDFDAGSHKTIGVI